MTQKKDVSGGRHSSHTYRSVSNKKRQLLNNLFSSSCMLCFSKNHAAEVPLLIGSALLIHGANLGLHVYL